MENVLTKNNYGFTSNFLKYIAITAMFFDHLFAVFVVHESAMGSILRITGRIVAPIMCYLIAEGYFYTKDINKYIRRLLIFSLISHIPYVLYFNLPWTSTSVMWGLTLGLITLSAVKSEELTLIYKGIILLAACILAYTADWNFISVLWIVVFGMFRGDFKKQMIGFSLIGLFLYIVPTILRSGWMHSYEFGIFLTIPLLYFYNGNQGKKSKVLKYGFYAFYPLHLLILYVINLYF